MLTADQLWDERQVGDLRGSPAKLENDDEWGKVDQTGPLRSVKVTANALVEDEGKGYHHTQRTCVSTRKEETSQICTKPSHFYCFL